MSYITVTNSDANSTYRMVWHSGSSLYSTGGIYCNPYTDYLYAGSFYTGNWFRSSGATGWYNESYKGGIYMSDDTWIRTYNTKKFYVSNSESNAIYTAGGVTATTHMWASSTASTWLDGQRYDNGALNIGNATNTGSYWPWIR
ncbi:shufflon system plasmid conjugative transfer pilus tip adhesin PilV [Intestinibacter sp.]|uniref:shufflon system plasmid conjugative transfer pilus tip adhesin PilV n=1 Tax=Intestinibacter sp. TaxID=1965304 RepID=UPI003F18C108